MNGNDFLQKLKKMGISQQKVADILGTSKQSVSAMRFSASVKTTAVEKIADAIGVTVSELLTDNPDHNLEELKRLRAEVESLKEELKSKNATIDRLIGIIDKMR